MRSWIAERLDGAPLARREAFAAESIRVVVFKSGGLEQPGERCVLFAKFCLELGTTSKNYFLPLVRPVSSEIPNFYSTNIHLGYPPLLQSYVSHGTPFEAHRWHCCGRTVLCTRATSSTRSGPRVARRLHRHRHRCHCCVYHRYHCWVCVCVFGHRS